MPSPKPVASKPAASLTLPKSARTVAVASKLPMTVELQLCRPETKAVTGRYGTEQETVNVKYGKTYWIRGTSRPAGTLPKGYKLPDVVDGGAAITPNVDADFFEQWLDQNKDTEIVRNGMIFAHASRDHVEGMAAERAAELSGLDPINPDQKPDGTMEDPRVPRPIDANVGPIKTEPRATDAAA